MFFGNLGHSEQETPAHIEDFSSEYIGNNENPLYVSPDAVAAHVWQQLVEETQRDLTERGVVVGMRAVNLSRVVCFLVRVKDML